MPLYVADYLGDTQHLSLEQHGAYLLLLMAMWRSGGRLPNDPSKLSRIVRLSPARWARIADDVMAFFDECGGDITQGRLASEIEKAAKKSQVRSEAGRAGAEAKALKNNNVAQAIASPLLKHSSEPEPELREEEKPDPIGSCPKPARGRISYPADFEEFWKGYPTDANMSKKSAFDVWRRMSAEDRKLAIQSLPGFRRYCENDPKYRPVHAERYLRSRRYEGHLAAAETVRRMTKVYPGTEQWVAWLSFKQGRGDPTRFMEQCGKQGEGFTVPSEWPPSSMRSVAA